MRLKKLWSLLLVAAMATGVVVTFTASPAVALSGEESQFLSSHNSIRAQHGRSALSLKSDLVSVARAHSNDMAAKGEIWHNPNLPQQVSGWTVLGENVGMGPSVNDLMDAFMNSTEHRDNILDGEYNQIGVGSTNSGGTIFVTVVFARRASSSSPAPKVQHTVKKKTTPRPAAVKPAPVPAPKPKPKPASAPPRTLTMLMIMIGLDATDVNPATGAASA